MFFSDKFKILSKQLYLGKELLVLSSHELLYRDNPLPTPCSMYLRNYQMETIASATLLLYCSHCDNSNSDMPLLII